MADELDMDFIAKALGVTPIKLENKPQGGMLGSRALLAEVSHRFRATGYTDSTTDVQQVVRLSPSTLQKLQAIAAEANTSPTRAAEILLERAISSTTRLSEAA
jgi:hypothetical protein